MKMATEQRLRLERVLGAACSAVYRAHIDPELLAQWWGPNGFSAPSVELDVRVGGAYRIQMQPPDGESFILSGEFVEVEPSTRLAYTFRWDPPDPDDRETLAVFSVRDVGGSTAVTVDQGVFATQGRREVHEQGWTESLDRLQKLLEASSPASPE
jgi:uncharacterized protein YndB with AHSA1/START domain